MCEEDKSLQYVKLKVMFPIQKEMFCKINLNLPVGRSVPPPVQPPRLVPLGRPRLVPLG